MTFLKLIRKVFQIIRKVLAKNKPKKTQPATYKKHPQNEKKTSPKSREERKIGNTDTGLNRFLSRFSLVFISPRKQLNFKYCGWVCRRLHTG